jgi:glycerophosphoryl diester phosphodiesterase
MFNQLPKPAIFAHRGASAHAPENTMRAFKLAIEQKADGIELDAKLSADGYVVVIHDQSVDRTTTTHGRVKDLSLSALLEMDAGSHFDIEFKGEPIPSLNEVLEVLGDQILINIELTNYNSLFDQLPEKVAELVKRYDLVKSVLISSFNPIALRRIKNLLPEVPLGLLARAGRQGAIIRLLGKYLIPYQVFQPAWPDATPELIKQVHLTGQKIYVYTLNQTEDIRQSVFRGVDGIYTDNPWLARRVILPTSSS